MAATTIDLSGWTELGAATVNGVDYQIYQSGSAYLGALFDRALAGTSAGETLSGYGGDDTISGGGGADTLLGKGGDDLIMQTAVQVNGAAGSLLNGGTGDDRLIFAGSQAYTANYVSMLGGDGNDVIEAAATQGQYTGSVKIEGGAGNDLIAVGHIEGSGGGLGYIDGGDGNDVIEVRDTWNGLGIWGNTRFQLRGGAGDDRFELAGTQVNVLGNANGAQLNGGSGFDTLVWNARYNLGIGRHQNPDVGLYAGKYAQELAVINIEAVDLAAGVNGLHLSFTAQDVVTLTSGIDFNRASLGLGLSGIGSSLFVNVGRNDIDLSGWIELGTATVNGGDYDIYQSGSSYLGVAIVDVVLAGTPAGETLSGYGGNDTISGGGGADRLLGSGGIDLITQTAAQLNDAAGSVLNGGTGDDRLILAGSQAYTAGYVSMLGGDGNDVIEAATSKGQFIGSVKIEGGAGNDRIAVGHIEGSGGGLGYIDGGDGNDVIQVLDTWSGLGIFGNTRFQLRGGAGDDRFELAGTQLNVLGNDQGTHLDGGSGFDTLVWNGRYNLSIGGHQNPDLAPGQYAQELRVSNIEAVELVAIVSSLDLIFTAQDVATLTSGSDFDRASLGLGLTGTGNTLFVNAGSNDIDLSGWTELGDATVNGGDYDIYQSAGSSSILAIHHHDLLV